MQIIMPDIVEQTSILDITPLDTDIVSPPSGYPTTVTASCKFEEEKEKMQRQMKIRSLNVNCVNPN